MDSTAKSSGPQKPLVCIVGAGMSGICACKYLLQHGIEPVVLEAQPSVGGVWRETFATTKLQTPRDAYQFSDYLWPAGTPDYPSHTDVKQYLHGYASKFHVMNCIRFNCKVLHIRRLDHGDWNELDSRDSAGFEGHCNASEMRWAVGVQNSSDDKRSTAECDVEWLHFDFLVLCVGRYGDIPKLPTYPPSKGPEIFQGKVLHSMDYAKLKEHEAEDLLRNKRVVVIGMMKSALDVAVEASNANQGTYGHPSTLIYRAPHWMLPHHKAFGLPLQYLYSTRFSEFMIAKPDQGFLLSVVSTLLMPLRWSISKFVEMYLRLTLPLQELDLVPKQTFFEQFASCQVPLLPHCFFQKVKDGQINLQRTESWSFSKTGVVLKNGTQVEADVVILGTGYDGERKLRSLLSPVCDEWQDLGSTLPLYRGVIHPRISHLAIMGFHENLSNLHSSEMGARWLAYLLSKKITLPSMRIMEQVSRKWIEYMRHSTPFHERSCIGAISIWHSDQVCQDLGWNPKRKKNFLQELFAPYSNMDYQD